MRRVLLPRASVALAAAILPFAAPATAEQPAAAPACSGHSVASEEDGSPFLLVTCGAAAAVLGRADDYKLVPLPALDAAAVVVTLDGKGRAWLLVRDGTRALAVEEITGTIARLAGRGARADIGGLDLDFSAAEGGGSTGRVSARVGGAPGQTIDFAQLVARSRSVRARAASAATTAAGGN